MLKHFDNSISPGPASYDISANNKLISTFDINRCFSFGKRERFKRSYYNRWKKDEKYEKKEAFHKNFYKFSKKPKTPTFSFTRAERFKNFEKIDYDKYKSIYL